MLYVGVYLPNRCYTDRTTMQKTNVLPLKHYLLIVGLVLLILVVVLLFCVILNGDVHIPQWVILNRDVNRSNKNKNTTNNKTKNTKKHKTNTKQNTTTKNTND